MARNVGPVLVGTDFSEAAGTALSEARRLAELLGTRVEVIHVVNGGQTAGWGEDGQAGTWLKHACVDTANLVIRYGHPWVELARYAAEVGPTLLVVGSHGQSGYQPLAVGSTATRISVHARCPVVLVSPRVVQADQETVRAGRDGAAAEARRTSGPIQQTEERTR
jgi:nucleotide-binding universal stress UspA family protein